MAILHRSATILGVRLEEEGALELSRRCRGTPRIANRFLSRVRDVAEIKGRAVMAAVLARLADARIRVPTDDQTVPLGLRTVRFPAATIADAVTTARDNDLPLNDATPHIEVDPDTFAVRVDGDLVTEQPAVELPMAQRYFLY